MASQSKKRRARRARQWARAELGAEPSAQEQACCVCGRSRTRPSLGEVAVHRHIMWAGGWGTHGDLIAYAYACSGVMVTESNRHFLCECDRAAWDEAVSVYRSNLPSACWEALGMNAELMVWAKGEAERLNELSSVMEEATS